MDPEEGHRLLVAEYSRRAAVYDRDFAPYHAPMVAHLLDLAEVSDAARILELGCGTGFLGLETGRRIRTPGFVIGIDSAAGMVHVANRKTSEADAKTVRFAHMDNRNLAFGEGVFDAVLSCFGISSLRYEQAFREVHRVLKLGGRFVFGHYSGGSKGPSIVGLLAKFRPTEVPDEVRRLLQARQAINATREPAAFMQVDTVLARLRAIRFRDVRHLVQSERVIYPNTASYLARGLAMGDNEREFRQMSSAAREAFLKEFEELANPYLSDEGLVAEVGVNYFVARK